MGVGRYCLLEGLLSWQGQQAVAHVSRALYSMVSQTLAAQIRTIYHPGHIYISNQKRASLLSVAITMVISSETKAVCCFGVISLLSSGLISRRK